MVTGSRKTAEGRIYTVREQRPDASQALEVREEWLSRADIVAQSGDVQFLPLAVILRACDVHRVPVFQRRYCWCKPLWKQLWRDVEKVRDNSQLNNHTCGRLMLLHEGSKGSRLAL